MPERKDSLRDRIRRGLTERIVTGAYRPGDRLVELQIAREFGVSQGTVREALLELEAMRLVESASYRGTRVRVIHPREIREAYYARGLIEEAAAPDAAKALNGDVAHLRAEAEAIARAAADLDPAGVASHNSAFHRGIVEASGNSVLLRLWDSLSAETMTRVRIQHAGDAEPLLRAVDPHLAVVEALYRGDGVVAGRLLRAHAETLAPHDDWTST